jgi:hypothetical protein
MGKTKGNAVKIYQITYLFGFALALMLHLVVNKLFPVKGLGIDEPFRGLDMVDGISPPLDDSELSAKEPITSEKQIVGDSKA